MAINEAVLLSDEAVKSKVVDQLRWDGRIDASNISITVDDREVTLSGQVPTYTAKYAAVDDTWLVSGVLDVEDELEVSYASNIHVPDDAEIRSNILDTLNWDPDLTGYKIDVEVTGGWVTLEGTVERYWEKLHAEYRVERVRGVIGVTNRLGVVPTDNITDEIVAEDIMKALDRNIYVNVDSVNVRVENGDVTLTGTVPTLHARTAAYNSARYTQGVVDVDNNLRINS